ncbi:saccharopine dehydrogenase (NAD+, L-lysine-forming) [Cribrihabitans marinus]|uniref:Saccharopine dehydrogenase [NAD(+), L-lysine-forming] n=1 Tax=Cribrihabitans marinus TaxID=1227549 RepID=A0A1H6XDQ9_9RHOB|nr:saccharopine dehydrogenase [Cribrihabitans marinus]GGH27226.1 saccharopine dehydrogenase [Cribrihabitans marinus]SEJ27273.1 saccharopine dehydrogenase (NAD+, L-lysine-forming) [Cribrihabitans marinus]
MTHLWVRAEQRANEDRVGLAPDGARRLRASGYRVTVEDSGSRVIPTDAYADAGCEIAPEGSWPDAPGDAIVFGLKELPEDGTPLRHRHIMFGHAFKGQHSGRALLERFKAGGGALYDLEYLTDAEGRRVAAFGYWAGYAGAAVSLMAWAAQRRGDTCGPVGAYPDKGAMLAELGTALGHTQRPTAIVIGALGRVGTGAADLCRALGVEVTAWDMAETASGGPFPEILDHDMFLNCIFARPGTPVFVPRAALGAARRLSVVGDVACDPDSDYNPVPVYDQATTWDRPVVRVAENPVLDVMAIDNLPSMLPLESSGDFAAQLLPSLLALDDIDAGVWARARAVFDDHIARI